MYKIKIVMADAIMAFSDMEMSAEQFHRPRVLCRSLVRICLVRVLAAKTEFKIIASKTIQHPAVTIERVAASSSFPSKHDWAGPLPSITQQRPLIARYAWPVDAALAKPRDCIDDRISIGRRNETRSLS